MRRIWFSAILLINMSVAAAPPLGSDGKFTDWFRSLRMPDSPGTLCCTVADCRMVEARWNEQTLHFEARVTREGFSNSLPAPMSSRADSEPYEAGKGVWMERWIAKFGDTPDVWVDISEAKINRTHNPTGHAVLCWSIFNNESDGVFCFVPFIAAINEHARWISIYG